METQTKSDPLWINQLKVRGAAALSAVALILGLGASNTPTQSSPSFTHTAQKQPIISPDEHYETWSAYAESITCKAFQVGLGPPGEKNKYSECSQIFAAAQAPSSNVSTLNDTINAPSGQVFYSLNNRPIPNPLSFNQSFEKTLKELGSASPQEAIRILDNINHTLKPHVTEATEDEKNYMLERLGGPGRFFELYETQYKLHTEQFKRAAGSIIGYSSNPNYHSLNMDQACDAFRYLYSARNLIDGRLIERKELGLRYSLPDDGLELTLRAESDQIGFFIDHLQPIISKNGCDKRNTPEPK